MEFEKPQAIDAVADRNLVGRLSLSFGTHQLFGRQALIGQAMLEPAIGKGEVRILPLQVARQLRQKRAGKRRIGAGHVGQHQDQVGRLLLDDADHALGPIAGQIAVAACRGDSNGDAPQILDQRQPQHQRQRPQLAQLERLDRLIGGDEAIEAGGIDAAIDMGNQLQGDAIGARKAGGRAARQTRQFAAVGRGKQPPDGADLLFDQVEIVEQPFGGRLDAAALIGRRRHEIVGLDQHTLVFVEPRQELIARPPDGQTMRGRDRLSRAARADRC